jgi:hypothetical protein
VRQCLTRSGAFLDEAIRPAIRRVALHTALVLPQFKDSDDLGDILHTLDEPSLSQVEKHYPG